MVHLRQSRIIKKVHFGRKIESKKKREKLPKIKPNKTLKKNDGLVIFANPVYDTLNVVRPPGVPGRGDGCRGRTWWRGRLRPQIPEAIVVFITLAVQSAAS